MFRYPTNTCRFLARQKAQEAPSSRNVSKSPPAPDARFGITRVELDAEGMGLLGLGA